MSDIRLETIRQQTINFVASTIRSLPLKGSHELLAIIKALEARAAEARFQFADVAIESVCDHLTDAVTAMERALETVDSLRARA